MSDISKIRDEYKTVRAAKSVSMRCERCSGTGAYITGTVNGRPTGLGGQCFRCQGRGAQTWEDGIRNRHHDIHAAVREMFAA